MSTATSRMTMILFSLALLFLLAACKPLYARDGDRCWKGDCLAMDENWDQCYRECTCGCWEAQSVGYYPDAVIDGLPQRMQGYGHAPLPGSSERYTKLRVQIDEPAS